MLQLIQTYSEIRGSILAGGYEPVSAFSCKQGRTSYTAADLPTRNQVSEAAYAASLASAGRLAALTSQVHCPTMFSRMPYTVFSDALQSFLGCFLGCPTKFSQMPYKVFSDALQGFLGCPTKFSRMPYKVFSNATPKKHPQCSLGPEEVL